MSPKRPAAGTTRIRKEIADAVVASLREVTGRGPVGTRVMMSPESIVVFLSNTLSVGEQELVKAGFTDEVLAVRSAYQATMRERVNARVSEITGREISAFMSTNNIEPDVAVEIFLLGDPVA
ncbi:Na-translocating system protein MpsC family protein [Patulibacter minatonensis]|uniref:Na-translocating system protein MpsC family protein n=1 Tax=Patulibacter minatonensis TaxID=298163 RepID=UPI00047967A7|nr:Na-translocating system protein MpsC family protein [Patulibacter minatonensis]